MNGNDTTAPHETLFWRSGFAKAVRKGNFKLIVNTKKNTNKLYDLASDPSEQNDLSTSNLEKVKELSETLSSWESELKAPLWKSWRTGRVKISENEFYNSPL